MDLDRSSLAAGETIVWQGNPSWRAAPAAILKTVGIGILIFLLLGLLEAVGVDINWTWWVIGSVVFVVAVVAAGLSVRHRFLYVLTDRQIIIRRGLLSRSVRTTPLDRVQNTAMTQRFVSRLMGVGTVEFATAAGTADAELRFVGVVHPLEVERTARELITGRLQPAQAAASASPPAPEQAPPSPDTGAS